MRCWPHRNHQARATVVAVPVVAIRVTVAARSQPAVVAPAVVVATVRLATFVVAARHCNAAALVTTRPIGLTTVRHTEATTGCGKRTHGASVRSTLWTTRAALRGDIGSRSVAIRASVTADAGLVLRWATSAVGGSAGGPVRWSLGRAIRRPRGRLGVISPPVARPTPRLSLSVAPASVAPLSVLPGLGGWTNR